MEDRIEERVTIRAALDKVWHLVARPGWWLPGSSAEPARGPGRVAVTYRGDDRPYVIDIVRVEPQGYASFRWASAFGGTVPAPGNATMVEFYLRPVGGELDITVVESGFASLDLPESLCESERKGNRGGWQYELAGLRTRAEAGLLSSGGTTPRTPRCRGGRARPRRPRSYRARLSRRTSVGRGRPPVPPGVRAPGRDREGRDLIEPG